MSYFVGPNRQRVESIPEAIEVAISILPERKLGDFVNIYKGRKDLSQVFASVNSASNSFPNILFTFLQKRMVLNHLEL